MLQVLDGAPPEAVDPVAGPDGPDDEQLALWLLYALHHRELAEVDEVLEWDPSLLGLRRRLEGPWEQRLRDRFVGPAPPGDVGEELFELTAAFEGASLSSYVQRTATLDQVLELLRHRSLYHLREFDPTAWVVPRLPARPKAALLELAFDEYGGGDPRRLHSHLFARGLRAVGLDETPGTYVGEAPTEVLEQNNAMSLFGLHRRWRGAAVGHLAAFEATSSLPSRRIALGLRRLGLPEEIAGYYDEHVMADAVHDQLACRLVCGSLVAEEPDLRDDVFLGAFTCLDLEARYAARMLGDWQGEQRADPGVPA
ncbi:iron-containing redox enzyme family protein [Nocardioides aestuarii]